MISDNTPNLLCWEQSMYKTPIKRVKASNIFRRRFIFKSQMMRTGMSRMIESQVMVMAPVKMKEAQVVIHWLGPSCQSA